LNKEEFLHKLNLIRDLMKTEDLDGILINSQANFSWLTGGRGFIGIASENSCASILVTSDAAYLLVNNIESGRLANEEVDGQLVTLKEFPWFQESEKQRLIKEIMGESRCCTDIQLNQQFVQIRSRLNEQEKERYRWLGLNTARAVERVCRQLREGMSEFEVAGMASRELWSLGIEPVTLLVAFDWRISSYRHPLPTDNRLAKYCMIAIGGRKWGLVASATRLASLGALDDNILKKHKAVAKIDTCFISNTRPGNSVKDIFNKAVACYSDVGYPEEWKKHHQGGLTGYAPREYRATPNIDQTVSADQAFAWNPSITGTKSEDTILVSEDKNEIITHTGEYAYIEAECEGHKLMRPDILIL
jgi:Xaa-Pro aminopeptidase